MSHISPLHLCTTLGRCRCWRTSRDGPLLNGAVAAVIATWLNYICPHKPLQHRNQIHSAGLLSALWLVSRGSSLQRSCTKLKYPLYGKIIPMHRQWEMAENQNIGWKETLDGIICHLVLLYNIQVMMGFPLHRLVQCSGLLFFLIVKSPSWRLSESETNTIKSWRTFMFLSQTRHGSSN